MNNPDHIVLANRFRDLNLDQRLLLANAWDAASARIFLEERYRGHDRSRKRLPACGCRSRVRSRPC
jgi:hypothetical protein